MKIVDYICKFMAEVLGTATLIFVGCLGTIPAFEYPYLMPSLSFGFAVMMMAQVFGATSGCHINPAVTFAAMIYRKIGPILAVLYLVAQVLGAYLGFGLLIALTPTDFVYGGDGDTPGVCSTTPNTQLTLVQAFFVEFVATGLLIFVICAAWDPRNAKDSDSFPLKIGLAIFVLVLATGPYTGASMNPARTLAPAIWNNDWQSHWIYWIAPISGAIVVSLFYRYVFWRPARTQTTKEIEEIVPSDNFEEVVESKSVDFVVE